MILAAHQPAYLPWLGYFDKIRRSDIFIYLDHVQFEKNSFINRNKIKTPQGWTWLTVPVKAKSHLESTLLELKIDTNQDWKGKHLKTIHANYAKSTYFGGNYPKLEELYESSDTEYYSDYCYDHLLFWLKELDIQTKIVRSSHLQSSGNKSDLILKLCQHFHADHYISGILGKGYLQEEQFLTHNITIEYQNYQHPVYPQIWGEFQPYMSVLDYWMNVGNNEMI